jgi:hemoglobin
MNMNIHKDIFRIAVVSFSIVALAGCGAGQKNNQRGFFTSGNKEADQRADQRMSQAQELKATDGKDAKPAAEVQKTLYDRLGGEEGVKKIVDDFVTRAMNDPRVNWNRKGVTKGGVLHRDQSVTWNPSQEKIDEMKKHIAQFIALSTGGPSHYDGKEIKGTHAGMKISNPEFDAAVGDMKATLDNLRVPEKEQKELLAIIESTRQQIVEER